MSDVEQWLDAEKAYQSEKLMGAVADALIAQDQPIAVPGPVLKSIADRMLSTGVRHGSDWVSIEEASVIPQWVSKGLEERSEPAAPIVEGELPKSGVAKVVSWGDFL